DYNPAIVTNTALTEYTEADTSGNGSYLNENVANQVQIYPNPSSGEFTLSLPNSNQYQVTVYAIDGKVIQTETVNGSVYSFKLNTTANGMYLLEISGTDFLERHRILVK